MSNHAWCSDPARDEAVRAAEDGRRGPLPTLEEAIAAITNHDAPPGARVSDSQCAGHADTGADTAGAGLRTERVTLEVTHDLDAPLGDWIVQVVDESLGLAETVRVVEESAPAASVAEQEPVAWGVTFCTNHLCFGVYLQRFHAEAVCERINAGTTEYEPCNVIPIYTAPPPARGWLTEEERSSIQHAANLAKANWSYSVAQELENILARSSPPEVVMPNEKHYHHITCASRDADWIAALAAAGVKVKEVGRE